jgi:hypothetical protein
MKHRPMLTDNAPLCNGSDTTLSNHSPIALLHLLLLGHVIYLSISSPLAPWSRIVNRSLCERSPFRDLPKSPYDIRSTAKNKLEPIDKKKQNGARKFRSKHSSYISGRAGHLAWRRYNEQLWNHFFADAYAIFNASVYILIKAGDDS